MILSDATLQKWRTETEGQFFDRKSARLAPKELASHISAFANASGGTVVLGIENSGEVTGINRDQENSLRQAGMDFLEILPEYKAELISTADGIPLLVLTVQPSHNIIIKTKSGDAYLRVGDQSRKLSATQLMELEYSRGTRSFENTIVDAASVQDLDMDMIAEYARLMNPVASEPLELLSGRGLIREANGRLAVTVAGILLFAKNPTQFLPGARVRFLRYEGTRAGVGTGFNIVKDITLDQALPKLLKDGQSLLESQMREFQHLSKEGVFVRIPEYPPFTWLEGLVNAVTHRDYSIQGDYIRISMFDDRLEFSSPGSLPSIVTVENIQNTRFSRNPMIARVLSDFGWVRELNEGVKRIYQDMRSYFLDPPVYQVLNRNTVCLTLKNNIAARSMRRLESGTAAWEGKWSSLAPLEQEIIYYLANVSKCTPKLLMELTDKSRPTINRHIKCLMESGLVVEHAASASDPTKYYELATTLK